MPTVLNHYIFVIRLESAATPCETVSIQTIHEAVEERSPTPKEGDSMELTTFARVTDKTRNQNGLARGDSNGAAPRTIERTSSLPRDYDDQSPIEPQVMPEV